MVCNVPGYQLKFVRFEVLAVVWLRVPFWDDAKSLGRWFTTF
jgi:hypothetical protein